MTVYWLDADACIHAKDEKNGAYPFSRAANFWAYLSRQVDSGVVRAPKMVYDEIMGVDDELKTWFQEREKRGLCVHPSAEVWKYVSIVSDFVVKEFGDRKARRFLSGADLFVLAHAMAMGQNGVVVSDESTRQQNAIVKIPAVCFHLKIEQITIHTMLNRLKARF